MFSPNVYFPTGMGILIQLRQHLWTNLFYTSYKSITKNFTASSIGFGLPQYIFSKRERHLLINFINLKKPSVFIYLGVNYLKRKLLSEENVYIFSELIKWSTVFRKIVTYFCGFVLLDFRSDNIPQLLFRDIRSFRIRDFLWMCCMKV